MNSNRKTIYEYNNYREFLRDAFASLKMENPKFSYRAFAKLAGFSSSSVLKNIIDGKRNIAHYNIEIYVKALRLNKEEGYYFRNLVLLNQSSAPGDKQQYAEAILRSRSYKRLHPLADSQFNFYAQWYYAIIWELVGLPAFKEDYLWISKKLSPQVTESEVKKALEELHKLGLLVRNENGNLIKSSSNLSTADEVSSAAIVKWHKEMMNRASESIDRVSREKRDISSVTMTMSKSMTKKVKEMIQQFRKELVEMQKTDEAGGDSVYQLNLQFFPHVETGEGSDN